MLDNKLPVDVIYLAFANAFEREPHRRLLYKLDHLGVRGPLLNWLSSYLRGRIFRVRVTSYLSDEAEVYSGVPQGSVIGPLLFLLYVSDQPLCIKSRKSFITDDMKLYCNHCTSSQHKG